MLEFVILVAIVRSRDVVVAAEFIPAVLTFKR